MNAISGGSFSLDSRQLKAEVEKEVAKNYVGVHFYQGVPLLDSDLNILNDLIAERVRGALARYIGDGIADFSDAFKIEACSPLATDDFEILAGTGVKTCLVNGLEAYIAEDTTYKKQNEGGASIGPGEPATLNTSDTDTVFLEVWEESVHDPEVQNKVVNLDTAQRVKVKWKVIVVEGGTDKPAETAKNKGHGYFKLATLTRTNGEANILSQNIQDERQFLLQKNIQKIEEPRWRVTKSLEGGYNLCLDRHSVDLAIKEVKLKSQEKTINCYKHIANNQCVIYRPFSSDLRLSQDEKSAEIHTTLTSPFHGREQIYKQRIKLPSTDLIDMGVKMVLRKKEIFELELSLGLHAISAGKKITELTLELYDDNAGGIFHIISTPANNTVVRIWQEKEDNSLITAIETTTDTKNTKQYLTFFDLSEPYILSVRLNCNNGEEVYEDEIDIRSTLVKTALILDLDKDKTRKIIQSLGTTKSYFSLGLSKVRTPWVIMEFIKQGYLDETRRQQQSANWSAWEAYINDVIYNDIFA